jgi:hypothetical protein
MDRTALIVTVVLAIVTILVLIVGDRTLARVRDFSWQDTIISAQDRAFILTFNRPMDRESVEANLQIEPALPGKASWAGRRMAYTLAAPAPYGTEFTVELTGARDEQAKRAATAQSSPDPAQSSPDADAPTPALPGSPEVDVITNLEPFTGRFRSRDRAFAYIGTQDSEAGRLVLYNLTRQQKTLLTPSELLVNAFAPYPDRRRILFAATVRDNLAIDAGSPILEQELYTVATGLYEAEPHWLSPDRPELGTITKVLDNQGYQNLKFDLSDDGQTILVQRADRQDPAKFGLWILREGQEPQPLDAEPGGDFQITPDGQAVAIAQGQGIALLPLPATTVDPDPEALGSPTQVAVDFLPQFGTVLAFAPDGSAAFLVKYNPDYTRSLFVVNNRGEEKELGRINGSVISGAFSPQGDRLYCLLTQLLPGEEYREQPYIAAIDLETAKATPLLLLPEQRELSIDLAPDGLAILFDRLETNPDPSAPADQPKTGDGSTITSSRLWLLPVVLPDDEATDADVALAEPQELPLDGFRPQWLP